MRIIAAACFTYTRVAAYIHLYARSSVNIPENRALTADEVMRLMARLADYVKGGSERSLENDFPDIILWSKQISQV